MLDFDIVVVNYKTPQYLLQCIESIKEFSPQVYLTLVDTSKENTGYGKACNIGAKKGNRKYIGFFNADTRVVKDWYKPIKSIFEEDSRIVVVAPKLINDQNKITAAGVLPGVKTIRMNRGWMQENNACLYDEHILECPTVCGALFFVRRDVFEKVGGFEERFFMYYEETMLCFKIRELGYKVIYTGDVTMYHQWNKAPKINGQQIEWMRKSKELFEKEYPGQG